MSLAPNFSAIRVERQLSRAPRIPTRIGRAEGGIIPDSPSIPFSGAIRSSVPGRTDHVPMHVLANSYVIPADVVSALGEGNSDSGHTLLDHMFKAPLGATGRPYEGTMRPVANGLAGHTMARGGGLAGGGGGSTPIMAAGGEYVIHPTQVAKVGHGDVKTGHKILDVFVKNIRAKTISTLKKLPGPAK